LVSVVVLVVLEHSTKGDEVDDMLLGEVGEIFSERLDFSADLVDTNFIDMRLNFSTFINSTHTLKNQNTTTQ